jgi:Protein of unknown function (DUF1326)
MKSLIAALLCVLCTAGLARAKDEPAWSMNATAIEGCSCPMFCQCYFNMGPAGHPTKGAAGHPMAGMSGSKEMEHFCKFNNAYKVNKGMYGATKLDDAKFWIYGDLGGDFSKGEMNWAVVTFDKATTPAQREAIGAIAGKLFPVKWKSLKTAEGDIEWKASKSEAHALLDGGKTAEVQLSTSTLNPNQKGEPIVMHNLKYFGAPRNDGFIMMPNVVEALRVGEQAYEFKGTNGFMITIDLNSKDFVASN